jgi:tRNA-uridine 2-sulfurtransferase
MNANRQVYVALSGGVDSTVAAERLLDAGYQVTGIFMETWKDPQAWVTAESSPEPAVVSAAAAAESVGIPFVSLDVRDRFYQRVVEPFLQQYLAGKTPNPCLFCNPQVKWGLLQAYAQSKGAQYFATGHYARIVPSENGQVQLLRGVDSLKDQSYVLALLSQSQLARTLLPLGEMKKTEVREQAHRLNLPVADREDSQDLCFLGAVDYRDFIRRHAPDSVAPGEIINIEGQVVGEHHGLAFYTIGQRRGLRIAAAEPYFVIDKDIASNHLIVGHADQATKRHLQAIQANWIAGEPPALETPCTVMIRYRAKPVEAELMSISMTEFRIKLSQPLRGITPGQVAVLYQGEVCLGGGLIQSTW